MPIGHTSLARECMGELWEAACRSAVITLLETYSAGCRSAAVRQKPDGIIVYIYNLVFWSVWRNSETRAVG